MDQNNAVNCIQSVHNRIKPDFKSQSMQDFWVVLDEYRNSSAKFSCFHGISVHVNFNIL